MNFQGNQLAKSKIRNKPKILKEGRRIWLEGERRPISTSVAKIHNRVRLNKPVHGWGWAPAGHGHSCPDKWPGSGTEGMSIAKAGWWLKDRVEWCYNYVQLTGGKGGNKRGEFKLFPTDRSFNVPPAYHQCSCIVTTGIEESLNV